jgi:hypothetical protein
MLFSSPPVRAISQQHLIVACCGTLHNQQEEASMKTPITSLVALLLTLPFATASVADKPAGKGRPLAKDDFAFSFDGHANVPHLRETVPIAAAGIITIDSSKSVANGRRTISVGGSLGLVCTNEFDCDLALDNDGSGNAVCYPENVQAIGDSEPTACETFLAYPETFAFAFEDEYDSFRYVGTDPGVTVLGSGRRQ